MHVIIGESRIFEPVFVFLDFASILRSSLPFLIPASVKEV